MSKLPTMRKQLTIHQRMTAIVRGQPCKVIRVDDTRYLERYYMGTTGDGDTDIWLHRILRPDVRHLHNHPFYSRSMVLAGGYLEERVDRAVWRLPPERVSHGVYSTLSYLQARDWSNVAACCAINGHEITPLDFHRIAVLRSRPCWTVLAVDRRRLPFWYFKEPGQPYQQVESSPRDWWRAYL